MSLSNVPAIDEIWLKIYHTLNGGAKKMKFRKIIVLLVITLAIQPVFAQGTENAVPGVTPDSYLYGLDVALDKISLLLTFDQGAKSRKGLEIARERLLEVKAMAEENKLEAMERAQAEHDDTLTTVESSLKSLERDDSTTELEDEVEIERGLIEHRKKIKEVEGEIKVKIEIKGAVTPEQKKLVDTILASMENKTGKVEIEIENKKDRTKIKIKELTGKSDEDVEAEVETVEKSKGVSDLKLERAAERIEDAKEEIEEAKVRLGNATSELLANAEEHLVKAEEAFNESKYGEAFGQSTAALNIAKSVKEQLEEEGDEEAGAEEEKEIEVKIEDGVAQVKVEIGDAKTKFQLNTTDREAIIAEIAERTGLTVDEVRQLAEFEEERKGKSEEMKETREKKGAELKILVEFTDGSANVEIEMDGNKTEFTLNTTDNAAIIAAISERTGLSAQEIEKVLKRTVKLGRQERPKEKEEVEREEKKEKPENKTKIEHENDQEKREDEKREEKRGKD